MDMSSSSHSTDRREEYLTNRRKEIFGDCALIEIIHLHDCLRGALNALEADVNDLAGVIVVSSENTDNYMQLSGRMSSNSSISRQSKLADLERRVTGRFKVIWSVFKSHSQAEDEFIWPALKLKSQGEIQSSPKNSPMYTHGHDVHAAVTNNSNEQSRNIGSDINLEQEEYEEDHADEERMFSEMDTHLAKLHEVLLSDAYNDKQQAVNELVQFLRDHTRHLSQHLMAHLEKEETQCMPLVIKYLSKSEIHELVGQIMGKRSADTIAQIMTMAVQNLNDSDREEMVRYMKQSMAGTFFDRWLTMSGWNGVAAEKQHEDQGQEDFAEPNMPVVNVGAHVISDQTEETELDSALKRCASQAQDFNFESKRVKLNEDIDDVVSQVTEPAWAETAVPSSVTSQTPTGASITSQGELEKLIRAIASNPSLTPTQKNTTIQGLRDSVWKSNQRQKEMNMGPPTVVNISVATGPRFLSTTPSISTSSVGSSSTTAGMRRVTPPSMYFKKTKDEKIEVVWSGDSRSTTPEQNVPLFSAAELAPTYHDGAAGAVLGCPHYARACKLRHPTSGRLYTCRLCCEQQREMPMRDKDEPLDRYAVTEVMCMKCNALQPAEDRCINADCESRGKPFAKYFCRICHLYDDGSRPIFHCPYCNACRLGLGLGVDFRHCMRCNACVSLADTDHRCIPQKLQGNCPICRETLFQSTEPLRGLKCGHVMHLSCFTEYRRGHAYTCPLCMRSMEDMKDYFALLDTAIRMQPMPAAYLSTMSNIYCQDCCETGRTRYHFVGQKCPNCGSYNTRELGRVHESPNSSPR
jgi:Zinc-ribbon/CHY zinc finger/Ring finger domain